MISVAAFTDHDNSKAVSTDTVKNVSTSSRTRISALETEEFGTAVAARFLERYPQVESVSIDLHEVKWKRMPVGGQPHAHSFVLDNNGQPYAKVDGDPRRDQGRVRHHRLYLHEVDRIPAGTIITRTTTPRSPKPATACARPLWRQAGAGAARRTNYTEANAKILSTMLEVFATTYSESVQDSLYRMGSAALAAVPEVDRHQPCLSEQALSADQPAAVRSQQRECGVRADRRAARPDRMRHRAGVTRIRRRRVSSSIRDGSRIKPADE